MFGELQYLPVSWKSSMMVLLLIGQHPHQIVYFVFQLYTKIQQLIFKEKDEEKYTYIHSTFNFLKSLSKGFTDLFFLYIIL